MGPRFEPWFARNLPWKTCLRKGSVSAGFSRAVRAALASLRVGCCDLRPVFGRLSPTTKIPFPAAAWAHAQEAAERGDRIDDMAADFLDHQTPDRPNSLAGRVVNGRAMFLIALNERMCRA